MVHYNLDVIDVEKETIRGSDCSGSNGDSNRTYVISEGTPISNSVNVLINGAGAHYTADWSFSGATITFLNPIFDTDYIDINYLI